METRPQKKPSNSPRLLDLPIRDGNQSVFNRLYDLEKLLDLPIRDGNFGKVRYPVPLLHLLDLPIRDGNIAAEQKARQATTAFRPSYQGWKLENEKEGDK